MVTKDLKKFTSPVFPFTAMQEDETSITIKRN
jgi:hypothetical protein